MTLVVPWPDVALRLILTVLASLLIGVNRIERGRPAGLRTNVLVGLAACVAMLQANLLMLSTGKAPDSFIVSDPMRLPLGILSGMGFIGAGTIIHQKDKVQGVTTAASLWFVTVAGLCFGGGQLKLASATTLLALAVLIGLRPVEQRLKQTRHATLSIVCSAGFPADHEIQNLLSGTSYHARLQSFTDHTTGDQHCRFAYEVTWRAASTFDRLPVFVNQLARYAEVVRVGWDLATED
ncbi:MAG TPA: MgtC/SapB family protein [Bryobacteraceae bacterium]|nr:MgtC/SapB family protein [Bryobacteraceae bacterium]